MGAERLIHRLAGFQVVDTERGGDAVTERLCGSKDDAAALAGGKIEGVVGIAPVQLALDHHEERQSFSGDIEFNRPVALDLLGLILLTAIVSVALYLAVGVAERVVVPWSTVDRRGGTDPGGVHALG